MFILLFWWYKRSISVITTIPEILSLINFVTSNFPVSNFATISLYFIWSGWGDLVFRLTPFAHVAADSFVFDSVRLFKSSKHATGMFPLVIFTVPNVLHIQTWSGWGDLNPRPQRPERCALTKLRYTPKTFKVYQLHFSNSWLVLKITFRT